MRSALRFKIFLMGLCLMGLFFVRPGNSSAEMAKETTMGFSERPALNSVPIYIFHEHLAEAEASILEPGKEKVSGIWQEDKFIFPNFEDETQIRLAASSYAGVSETGISFNTLPGALKKLRFQNVPIGSTLILYYGIDDDGVNASKPEEAFYLRIWSGNHELRRLRISNNKGWNKAVIPLGVLSFLKHEVTMTFETISENRERRRLSFRAEILP